MTVTVANDGLQEVVKGTLVSNSKIDGANLGVAMQKFGLIPDKEKGFKTPKSTLIMAIDHKTKQTIAEKTVDHTKGVVPGSVMKAVIQMRKAHGDIAQVVYKLQY